MPTAAVLIYTAKTFQDKLLTNRHYWFRRSTHYAVAIQCFQISDSASQANGDERCPTACLPASCTLLCRVRDAGPARFPAIFFICLRRIGAPVKDTCRPSIYAARLQCVLREQLRSFYDTVSLPIHIVVDWIAERTTGLLIIYSVCLLHGVSPVLLISMYANLILMFRLTRIILSPKNSDPSK
ncbi:hypothetical protein ARMSODRAFT_214980 [Armillaria solidipes]|uniref:Uncharacterized protein n=1 Tax=Armillaria solidipes TaxID=1076256 RepID=A0A2H3BHE3_9AGAR|nr:hypothetical protein ARMSODRAFT_214980 [Armillaria solidipes]